MRGALLMRALMLAALAVVLALSAAGTAGGGSLDGRQQSIEDELDELRDKIGSARDDEQSLDAEIAALNDEVEVVQADVHDAGDELAVLEQELAAARGELATLEERLRAELDYLALAREQLAVAQGRLADRIVELYTSPEPDLIEVILGSESLEDLIDRVELYSRLVEQDAAIVDDIERVREEMRGAVARTTELRERQAAQTATIARQTARRRDVYTTLVAERDRLASLRSERGQALASLVVDRREWESEAEQLEEESRQVAALIAASASSSQVEDGHTHSSVPSGSAVSSSGFIWPVGGTITSPYGPRWGRLHTGIDIAAPGGAPVGAAAAGQVVYAGWLGGYGLLVVVQHAGDLATAYAHNSSISVSVGQTVSQGETIAAVGCTGHCTGNHVHFEVRVGGSPVDPLGYL